MNQVQNNLEKPFDYSLVNDEVASYLQDRVKTMHKIVSDNATKIGEQLYLSQKKLADFNNEGLFGKWIESTGFSRSSAYNYINRYNAVQSLDSEDEIKQFESLPKNLTYDISKPSAPKEAVDAVMSGDITTHKEYKELERKLRLAQEENADKDAQIERLNNRPEPKAKVIEKEVEIEKIPDDYHYFKGNFESIKAVNERLQNENKQIREELKSHSNEPNIDNSELLAKKEKLEAEISTLKNVAGLGEEINDFINRVSSYEYQIDMKQLVSKRDVLRSIYEAIGGLKKWCSDFEKELPTQNFIEGEMNHE